MEKSALKEIFFIGADEEIDAFVADLKARCLKPTDKALKDENGNVLEKLIFNTEDQTYVSQHMKKYQVCPICGKLEEVDEFQTLELVQHAWYKKPGSRLYTKSERVCRDCAANSFQEDYYVPGYYARTENMCVLHMADGTDKWAWKNTRYYGFKALSKVADDGLVVTDNEFVQDGHPDVEAIYTTNGRLGCFYVMKSELENCDFVERCSNCGQLWLKVCLDEDHKCPNCRCMRIYSYHAWDQERTFKSASGEAVGRKTLYFGTEIETEGSTANSACVSPIADIFHLERDGSLGSGSFEMISQPMTWNYIEENRERIEQVFNNLIAHGQKSHETSTCGLHIHVSRAALDGERAEKRILAIVHGMRHSMKKFARRNTSRWASYDERFDGKTFSEERLDRIDKYGHSVAVNCGNTDSQKNTVEFRIFKGTLNITTYLASIQFVKNIVDAANGNAVIVRFNDLLQGEYIERYIQEQSQHRDLNSEEYVNFAQCILGKKLGEFSLNHTREEFQEIVTVLSQIGGFGAVEISFPEETDQEGGDQ